MKMYGNKVDLMFAGIFFMTFCGAHFGQRVVETQRGPLFRAEGSHVTLSCKVRGYEGTPKQNFHWSIYRPASPSVEIHIVSTADPHFTYALYRNRVRMQDIYIERTSTDSVLLHITKLQAHDQGEYECYTPNTDSVYYGAYSDKTILTVIPDTLQARISALSIRRAAGESLSLSCDVSKRTSQHTHLSISWFLQIGGETLELVTLTREFILQAGTAFHHRLESGHLRLDRSGLTTYLLTIFQLQHSDQGEIYCEATEWIQDPDKSWYPLLIKRTESTKVTVEQRPLAADVQESEYTTDSSVPKKTFQPLHAHGVVLQVNSLCSDVVSVTRSWAYYIYILVILFFVI